MAAPPPSASEPLIDATLVARFEAGLARAVGSAPRDIVHYPSAGRDLHEAGGGPAKQKIPACAGVTMGEGEHAPTSIHASRPLALAVSGGPDSMAMLALAAAARPGGVIAATFDHGLRPASAAEGAMVAEWCAVHAIPHATLHPDRPLPVSNVQAAARTARYAALGRWAANAGAALLATAHHADDQAETFLMRANRGSGPTGLAGIRRARPLCAGVTLVRPLLDWRRAELAAIAAPLPVAHDPGNADPRYTRVRARQWLAATPGLDPAQLAHAADHVAAMADDLEALAGWAWRTRRSAGEGLAIDVGDLPRALRRLLVRRAIAAGRAAAAIDTPAFGPAANVEALLNALERGRRATQAGVVVTPRGTVWHVTAAPPRRMG